MSSAAERPLGAIVRLTSPACLGTFTLAILVVGYTPAQAQTNIESCVNPAGQIRIIAPGASCRSQETLLTWNAAGAAGPKGDKGDPGADAPAIIVGSDRGPVGTPGNTPQPASLQSTPTPLTT